MSIKLFSGDAVKWAQEYDGEPFHALLCDAPYHLTSIVKRYSKSGPTAANLKTTPDQGNSPYERGARGFMGKTWDGGDVAFRPETWAAFMQVLHPGAFGMSFAGSRGWHRLACAIEDAGFVIHPTIFGWAYGSGFPKATRIKNTDETEWLEAFVGVPGEVFDGYRYGLQALKPALEPIIVFQKPYENKPVTDIVFTGAGALNIDGSRIPGDPWKWGSQPDIRGGGYNSKRVSDGHVNARDIESDPRGRWPANFILLDPEAAQRLDRQSGRLVSGEPSVLRTPVNTSSAYGKESRKPGTPMTGYGDSGGASRFFFRVQEQIDEADPVYYQAKADREERDAGLGDMPDVELGHNRFDKCAKCGGYLLQNPNRPSACTCSEPERQNNVTRNPHPTVKPISLARYLATLLLPPVEYSPRKLFVPFAGVASECIGAMQAGWDVITGVELTEEYIPIAQARVDYWKNKGWQTSMFAEV